jgi:hypothetical protein
MLQNNTDKSMPLTARATNWNSEHCVYQWICKYYLKSTEMTANNPLDFRDNTLDFRDNTLDFRDNTLDFRYNLLDFRCNTLDFRNNSLDFRCNPLDIRWLFQM